VTTRVLIDDAISDERGAVISVFDRGFLYGDSVYEVARTSGGHPVDLERHLERLARSAAAIGMQAPPRETLVAAVRRTLEAAGNRESYLRVIVTRGGGEIGLDPAMAERPRLIVIVKELALPDARLYASGCDVALVAVRRNPRRALDPSVKSGNYLNNILALAEARREAAYESVMLNPDGRLVEGSTSNVFLAPAGGGGVVTPAFEDGLLDGITRRRVLELAVEAGIPAAEAHLGADDLLGAAEAFLTSSIRGILPIARVDGRALPAAPGPLTRELMRRYQAFLDSVAREGSS
jgi:branched-chain amino acid aminotransferase